MKAPGLTRAWRDLSTHVVVRAAGGAPAPLPDWSAAPRRVLFLRHDRIGDMIMSTAIIRAIARSHPTITLDVVASPVNAPVLDGIAEVREVLVLPRAGAADALRLGRSLRGRRYDAVVDGLVTGAEVRTPSAMLMAGCGAGVRIGLGAGREREFVYTATVPPPAPESLEGPAHHVDLLAQLAIPFGVEPATVGRPAVVMTAAELARGEAAWRAAAPDGDGASAARLLVNVSAGHPSRRWPDERFVAVLRHVRERRPALGVGVIGDPRETASVRAIADAVGGCALDTPTVRAALGVVAAADRVFSPDTAIVHAAAAFGKPCVTLTLVGYEPWAPYRTPGTLVMSPTLDVRAVPVARVIRALDAMLEG